MMVKKMINIGLVNTNEIFTQGLRIILEEEKDMKVIELGYDSANCFEQLSEFIPDVLLVHLINESNNAHHITRELKMQYTDMKIIYIYSSIDLHLIKKGIAEGVVGFLLSCSSRDALISSIRNVYYQQFVFANEIVEQLFKNVETDCNDIKQKIRGGLLDKGIHVSWRDSDILYLIYKGYKNTEIANELHLSEKTVRDYVSKVYKKLHTNNRDKIREYVTAIINEGELKIDTHNHSEM